MSTQDVFDRPIAFHRSFVALGVGVAGALMLSQAVYWSKRTNDPEGWFYKSMEDWTEETGLTRTEQEKARRALCAIGVLHEKRRGVPARLYFRVDTDELLRAVLGNIREVTLDEVLTNFSTVLSRLSKAGLMRAKKLKVHAEFADYSAVLKAKGMVCGICGEPIVYGPGKHARALAFDHIEPLAGGGPHTLQNLQPAHFACNSRKCDSLESGADASLPTVSNQECLEDEQSCLSTVSKQERLPKASKPASGKQTFTENKQETTAGTTPVTGQAPAGAKPGEEDSAHKSEPRLEIPADMPGPKDRDCKTFRAWANYCFAYRRRYQQWPVWNAAVAGQLGKVIDRLGVEVAPKVAAYYLLRDDALYAKDNLHPVSLLLAKAETLHTQYQQWDEARRAGRELPSTQGSAAGQMSKQAAIEARNQQAAAAFVSGGAHA